MKRRVLIAKALSHRPKILFLDEPTAGVDIALRRDMGDLAAQDISVRDLVTQQSSLEEIFLDLVEDKA